MYIYIYIYICTESFNDPALVAGSSPRKPASVLPTYFDDTCYKMTGRWFRQIIPLSWWYTPTPGTNFTISPQNSRFHIPGASGPKKTLSYSGVSRSEFHVRCLRIRFDSQGVVFIVLVLGVRGSFGDFLRPFYPTSFRFIHYNEVRAPLLAFALSVIMNSPYIQNDDRFLLSLWEV
jgi:hypothetical protein